MRLLLIRHGRSAHVGPSGLLDRAAVEQWRDAYDAAGIAEGDEPPPELKRELANVDAIAASDLPRAIASAARLAGEREVLISPLVREVPLAIPESVRFRVPLAAWALVIHARWALDIVRGSDMSAEVLERVRAASAWCSEVLAKRGTGASLAVVTHGVVRRMLARQLVIDGWSAEPGGRSYDHWSVWRFSRDGRATRWVPGTWEQR